MMSTVPTVATVRGTSAVLFECIAGSRAYGLATATSDTDLRGVFLLDAEQFFGLHYTAQINSDNNNIVLFELGRFVELLAKNNPNVIELLGIDEEYVQVRHPLFSLLTPSLFLSRRCLETFGRYAYSQIQKAQGLNKKIFNPMPAERKTVGDFCSILHGYGSRPLADWLHSHGYCAEHCGLVRIPHFRDTYAVFYDSDGTRGFRGITTGDTSNDVALSSVPEGMEPVALLSFNRDAYSRHCREYTAYRQWERERNEERYRTTTDNNRNYDAKNMMHVFRLLGIAEDIARHGEIRTRRPDREELLAVRNGVYTYEQLTRSAEQRLARIEELFARSPLPDAPDEERIGRLLMQMRVELYGSLLRS